MGLGLVVSSRLPAAATTPFTVRVTVRAVRGSTMRLRLATSPSDPPGVSVQLQGIAFWKLTWPSSPMRCSRQCERLTDCRT